MKILDEIKKIFPKRARVLTDGAVVSFAGFDIIRNDFSTVLWYNICDLLADLTESITIKSKTTLEDYSFAAFRTFFYSYGRVVWLKLFDEGQVVIGWDGVRFWLMNSNEYHVHSLTDGTNIVEPLTEGVEVYVMKSPMYELKQISDRQLCRPWLDYIDSVCNTSDAVCRRMGAVVVVSPKAPSSYPTIATLDEDEKKELEKQMQEQYGTLKNQSSVMVLPREMSFQTVSLAGLDAKASEKIRNAVLAICDRIKVPANQVALVDAQSSKSLSNGSELRAGDAMKYKSARRMFERTFVQMGNTIGVRFDYSIDGEPLTDTVTSNSTTE